MTGTEFARISGSYSTAFIGTYQLTSQSTSTNKSTFTLRAYFYYGGGTSVSSSYSTFKIDGTTVKTGSYTYSHGYHLLGSKTITVTHNNNGSWPGKSVGISANSSHMSGSKSGSLSAPAIKRFASITNSPSSVNDESSFWFSYSNPANARMSCWLEINPNNTHLCTRTLSGTSGTYTWTLTEAERNQLRACMPNKNSGKCRIGLYSTIGGTTNASYVDKTFTIVNANPTFSNFEFEDVNTTTLALTGNNQNIIQGYSNVKATVPVEYIATANKSATMSKYSFTCSDVQRDIAYSSSESTNNNIENVKSGVFNVYAIDSRNNSTLVTKNANQTIAYTPVTKGNITITRQNGVSEATTLTLSGTVDLVDFGQVVNSIQEAKYRYKTTDSSTWSNYTDITLTIDNNGNFSFNDLIQGDTNEGFNVSNSYNIEVLISDELSSAVFTANLGSGIPNIALHKQGVGIMGKYNENVGGLLQVAGINILTDFSTDEVQIPIKWVDGNYIYKKAVELSFPNTSSATAQTSHYIENMDKLVFAYIVWYDTKDNRWYMNFKDTTGTYYIEFNGVSSSDIKVTASNKTVNWDNRTKDRYALLYYTKTNS